MVDFGDDAPFERYNQKLWIGESEQNGVSLGSSHSNRGQEPQKGYAVNKSTTNSIQGQMPEVVLSLDELAREGAQRMIAEALQLEAEMYAQKLRHLRDANGHALVVRNGKARPRKVRLGAGVIEITAPRVDDRRSDQRFTSDTVRARSCRRICVDPLA